MAFSTPYGLYQFVTLPFGLFGAPATFQRLMEQRCCGPHAAYADAYLDDVIIHSGTWAEHVRQVAAVARVTEAGGAHGQSEEVCSWTEGGTVSGVPLGRRAGASRR